MLLAPVISCKSARFWLWIIRLFVCVSMCVGLTIVHTDRISAKIKNVKMAFVDLDICHRRAQLRKLQSWFWPTFWTSEILIVNISDTVKACVKMKKFDVIVIVGVHVWFVVDDFAILQNRDMQTLSPSKASRFINNKNYTSSRSFRGQGNILWCRNLCFLQEK